MQKTHLTLISHNSKTGPIPVSTSSKQTCPATCPFKGNGCYAEGGPINIHWTKVSNGERGVDWREFCDSIKKLRRGQLWRHNQAGDLAGSKGRINATKLLQLVKANQGRRGFTYTHYQVEGDTKLARHNRDCIRHANKNGFTINLSANGEEHAKRLTALKIGPVVTVVHEDFKTNNNIVVCPATIRDDVSCNTCELCQKQHSKTVGFPVHGVRKKLASKQITK